VDNFIKSVDNSSHIVDKPVYNKRMDYAMLYVYWIYGMIGLSGLLMLLAIKESIWPGDK
jgi:hypothetical protein